jgi:Flp pilus assembly protein TadG
MGEFLQKFRTLSSNTAGNVLPMAAVGVIIIAAMVGGSVDMGRAYKVKNRLQAACDAGSLAGRKTVSTNGFDSAALAAANSYFNADFDETALGSKNTAFTPTTPDSGQTINATATTTLPTAVMSVFGKANFDIAVTCSASMGVGNSDVVMVLDTTGSMDTYLSNNQTRIQALRAAMKNFRNTVAAATAGTNARIRYGFVPYSSGVNVGALIYNKNPAYLRDSYPIQSRTPIYVSVSNQVQSGWAAAVTTTSTGVSAISNGSLTLYSNTSYTTSSNCTAALPAAIAWANDGNSSTDDTTVVNSNGQQVTTTTVSQPQQMTVYTCALYSNKYYRYYKESWRTNYSYTYNTRDPVYQTVTTQEFDHYLYQQVTYNTSAYKAFTPVSTVTGDDGTTETSTWDGCIEERATVSEPNFTYSSLTGITPTGAKDLDMDSAPTSDDSTKWAPMWPEISYYRTSWVSSRNGGSYKIANIATSLTGGKTYYSCPKAAKLLATMTQTDFESYADSLFADGNTYHDIGMIWGARLSSPGGIFASNVNVAPSNGGSVARHIIYMTDGEMNTDYTQQSTYGVEFHDRRVTDDGYTDNNARHSNRFNAMCEAVKGKGIRIWVIVMSSTLTTSLEDCASDNSAFTASSSSGLNTAFQTIAKQVGELRVTQ